VNQRATVNQRKPNVLNETHALLRAYATSTRSLTVAGTVRQFTDWYAFLHGTRISERTFKRHTKQLSDAGVIQVRHTKRCTRYTLLKEGIIVPRYRFLPTSDPQVFDIVENGTETLRYEPGLPSAVAAVSLASFDDIDLDALQESWGNTGSQGRPFKVIALDPPRADVPKQAHFGRAASVSDAA
jgi:hypothetical protein